MNTVIYWRIKFMPWQPAVSSDVPMRNLWTSAEQMWLIMNEVVKQGMEKVRIRSMCMVCQANCDLLINRASVFDLTDPQWIIFLFETAIKDQRGDFSYRLLSGLTNISPLDANLSSILIIITLTSWGEKGNRYPSEVPVGIAVTRSALIDFISESFEETIHHAQCTTSPHSCD